VSTRRRSTISQSDRELRNQRGPSGRRLCRFCRKEVPKGKRTFCSDACVHEWKLRSDPGYLREQVFLRDLGICAKCKTDTRRTKILVQDVLHAARYDRKDEAYRALLADFRLTAHEAEKSLWQADHIRPVAEGGGECGLENIQTICTKCHKLKTAIQAGKNAKPRKIKPDRVGGIQGLPGLPGITGKFE
jgi:5-methylcytosine-specific restriction protein A